MTLRSTAHLAVLTLVLSACSDDPRAATAENFAAVLEPAVARHPVCMLAEVNSWAAPVSTEHPFIRSRTAWLEALEAAGVLRSKKREVDTGVPVRDLLISELLKGGRVETIKDTVSDYTWTETGRSALTSKGLCFGTPQLERVVRWTEPAEFMGSRVSEITYTYRLRDVPTWANHPAIRSTFPEVEARLSQEIGEGKAMVALTNEGWRVME